MLYINRPSLDRLFERDTLRNKQKRDKKIAEAKERYGYSQKEVTDYLGMHFTSISRIMRRR